MYIEYADITDRIAEEPRWWLDGVPRYCDFTPRETPIGTREAALVLVRGYSHEGPPFHICAYSPSSQFPYGVRAALAAYGTLYVGDPPNYQGRAVPHAQASPIEILEYWASQDMSWRRDPRFEIRLEDENGQGLYPAYQLLASELAGLEEWKALIARRDVRGLQRLLEQAQCPDAYRAVVHIINEAVAGEHIGEFWRIWDGYSAPD